MNAPPPKEPSHECLADRIRRLVDMAGSYAELGRRAGVSGQAIKNYTKGAGPRRPVAERMARIMKVRLDWLLNGEGPMYAKDQPEDELTGDGLMRPSETRPVGVPSSPEMDVLRDVIEAVEEVFRRQKLHLPPKKKAELIMLLYEEIAEDESKKASIPARVLRLVKLAS